jgi:hypothetical protein
MTTYRSLHDVYEAKVAGEEVPDEILRTLEREEALARSAITWPGSALKSAVRSTMFEGSDYRIFWSAAIQVYEELAKKGPEVTALNPSDVVSAMTKIAPRRFIKQAAVTWMTTLLGRPAVSLPFAQEVLIPEKVAAHHVGSFRDKTALLNSRVGHDDPVLVYNDYLTSAAEIARVPDGGSVGPALADEVDEPFSAAALIVPSGIGEIDKLLGGGPSRGDLVVVGGGTNHGKSYMGEQLAHVLPAPHRYFYLSVEDAKEIIKCRSIARFTDPPLAPVVIRSEGQGLLAAEYDADSVARAKISLKQHQQDRVFVDVKRKAPLREVCQVIRRYRYQRAIDAVFVDYLQAITPDEPSGNTVEDTSVKVSTLKKLAGELGIVLYLGSQYSREAFKNGEEPGLTACKYAGDIENESEVMILFWRDDDDVLHAKLPKIKWVRRAKGGGARFFVRTHPTTGCFLRWEHDFHQQQPGPSTRRPAPGGRQRSGFP